MEVKKIINEEQLKQAFHIRKEVFVHEQHVSLEDEFDEYDHLDAQAKHVLAISNNTYVGTGRIRFVDGVGKLERICILKPYRSLGIGKRIITTLEEIARTSGVVRVMLHGQTQAEGFYHKLGYQTCSEAFMEDGILHLRMEKELVE